MANKYTYMGAAMIFAGIAFRTMRWVWRTSREVEKANREDRLAAGSHRFIVHKEELLLPGKGVESPPCPNCGKPLALKRVGGKSEPFRCRQCGWVVRVEIDKDPSS